MPELPEVETILNGIKDTILGNIINKIILNRPNLRIPFPQKLSDICNATVTNAYRRSKYMLWELDTDDTIIIHLGMTGKFGIYDQTFTPQKHDHVEFHFGNDKILVLNDTRRFGLVTITDTSSLAHHPLLAQLGPEPLEKEFSYNYFCDKIRKSAKPIKNLIMDNHIIVGVGNIYACESLFRSGINPARIANSLSEEEIFSLHTNIIKVLKEALEAGGSTIRDYQNAQGQKGYFQHNFSVYNQTSCKICFSKILKINQAGRSSFFCPNCQK